MRKEIKTKSLDSRFRGNDGCLGPGCRYRFFAQPAPVCLKPGLRMTVYQSRSPGVDTGLNLSQQAVSREPAGMTDGWYAG